MHIGRIIQLLTGIIVTTSRPKRFNLELSWETTANLRRADEYQKASMASVQSNIASRNVLVATIGALDFLPTHQDQEEDRRSSQRQYSTTHRQKAQGWVDHMSVRRYIHSKSLEANKVNHSYYSTNSPTRSRRALPQTGLPYSNYRSEAYQPSLPKAVKLRRNQTPSPFKVLQIFQYIQIYNESSVKYLSRLPTPHLAHSLPKRSLSLSLSLSKGTWRTRSLS